MIIHPLHIIKFFFLSSCPVVKHPDPQYVIKMVFIAVDITIWKTISIQTILHGPTRYWILAGILHHFSTHVRGRHYVNIYIQSYVYIGMDKKVITGVVMVSIFMATAFVPMADNLNNTDNSSYIPAISSRSIHKTSIFNIKPSGKAYNSNNNGVIFSGSDPYIKLNNQYYPSQWSVLNKSFNREKLRAIGNRSINNRVQNSAVEALKNNNISVAYIYSFYGSGVHASAAIKNLNNSTVNYTVQLNVILPSSNIMEVSNNHSINKHFNYINGMNVMNIRRTYNPLIFGNVMANPLNSIPALTMVVKDSNYAVLNMQYCITLTANETYTIDPAITGASDSSGASNCATHGNITTSLSTGGCVFNSNGAEVGVITETAQTPSLVEVAGPHFSIHIDSTFSPISSSYNVNCIEQKIVDNNGGSGNFIEQCYKSFLQDHQERCSKTLQSDINAAFYFPAFAVISKPLVTVPADTSLLAENNDDGFGTNPPATAHITLRK